MKIQARLIFTILILSFALPMQAKSKFMITEDELDYLAKIQGEPMPEESI